MNYSDYIDVDKYYYPCLNKSAINNSEEWKTTYPNNAFISLLTNFECMLGGRTQHSLWISGVFGSGKSRCAYTLKKIIDAPENEVRAYWDKYELLKCEKTLLERIIEYKKSGTIAAYLWGTTSRDYTIGQIFKAVYESIKEELIKSNAGYTGENALKESVISWLEDDECHKQLIDDKLQKPEWKAVFSQLSADSILDSLRKGEDVTFLMKNILDMADAESIDILDFTSDVIVNWITDVITGNNIRIVLILDEFLDIFLRNSPASDEFQKLVALCRKIPFYPVIVTGSIVSQAMACGRLDCKNIPSSLEQFFIKKDVSLPDIPALELIGRAFSPKSVSVKVWETMTDDLLKSVERSGAAVLKSLNIQNKEILRSILPIHPVAALVLKNISPAIRENQRSMFVFMSTPKDLGMKTFGWFISNHGPASDRRLLTVDMLWDVIYDKGQIFISKDAKSVLDTYKRYAGSLSDYEKIVLKTILLMQVAYQQKECCLSVLEPTVQNLTYAFEGDMPILATDCISIAGALLQKGILIEKTSVDGKKYYEAVPADKDIQTDAAKKNNWVDNFFETVYKK